MPRISSARPLSPFIPCHIEPRQWQIHVNRVLSIHWTLLGAAYQRVPDRTRGDRGLEGFSTVGDAIQAYADIESRSSDERRKGQMGKIRKDLQKLVKHAKWWEATLQGLKLRTWTLVVPTIDDANIVQYARKKGAELANQSLSFIDASFQAMVSTDQDFSRALELVQNPSLAYRAIPVRPVEDHAVTDFVENTPNFIVNVNRKIKAYVRSQKAEQLAGEQEQQLKNHLKCSNFLEDMRVHFPSVWEQIEGTIASLADRISTENRASELLASQRIRELLRDFGEALKSDVQDLPQDRQLVLANGLVARWLGDCTLEFTT